MSQLTKVFIVTSGEYSDYSIEGAFSSLEKAEEFVKGCRGGDTRLGDPGCSIEEYDLDSRIEEVHGPLYFVKMLLETGAVEREWADARTRHPSKTMVEMRKAHVDFIIARSPVSREHARKTAVEYRQNLKREQPYEPIK